MFSSITKLLPTPVAARVMPLFAATVTPPPSATVKRPAARMSTEPPMLVVAASMVNPSLSIIKVSPVTLLKSRLAIVVSMASSALPTSAPPTMFKVAAVTLLAPPLASVMSPRALIRILPVSAFTAPTAKALSASMLTIPMPVVVTVRVPEASISNSSSAAQLLPPAVSFHWPMAPSVLLLINVMLLPTISAAASALSVKSGSLSVLLIS